MDSVLIALKMELVDEGPGSAIGNVHTLGNSRLHIYSTKVQLV